MSGTEHITARAANRRIKRTRKAVLDAFLSLLAERRYSAIKVADIIARADVGRSTFYDHFTSKDDILLHSMSWIYAILADVVVKDASTERLAKLLEHFWENRKMVRGMLVGPSAAFGPKHGTRHLACEIELRLQDYCQKKRLKPLVPLLLVATQTAEGVMALLRAWLLGEASCKPQVLADAIHASATSAAAAFLKSSAK